MNEEETPQEFYERFDVKNPLVFFELVNLAFRLRDKGHTHYSIQGLFEVLRFRRALRTDGDDYKMNNNLKPFYARAIMKAHPALDGFFEIREGKYVTE